MNKEKAISTFISIAVGTLAGVFLHYMLFLMSLPPKPFIYAWF